MRIIAGSLKNRRLKTSKGDVTRPTTEKVRGALFNICQHRMEECDFLDLFAGSGAIGFEALSRGARSVTFVERDRQAVRLLQENAKELGVEGQVTILQGDVYQQLERLHQRGRHFGIVYADPPYGSSAAHKEEGEEHLYRLVEWFDKHELLQPGGDLFIEQLSKARQVPEAEHFCSFRDERRLGSVHLYAFEAIQGS